MPQRAVYKTTNAEYLDRAYQDPQAFDVALDRLENAESLVDVAQDLETTRDLPKDSANDFTGFIQEKGPDTFEQVVRHGYRTAFQLAIHRNQPIETFWVTAPGDDFEVHICEGRQSIVVFMFIPGEESRQYGSTRALSRSWVVRVDDPDVHPNLPRMVLEDGIVQIQLSGQGGYPGGNMS